MTIKKGQKRVKNEPVHYEQLKEKHTIHVTPSTWGKVKKFAKKEGVSVSVYIEELIRKQDA